MGKGYAVTCGKCKHRNEISLGSGMWFPRVYEGIIKGIRGGEFGEEWRAIESSAKHIAVDARRKLYYCPECGNWENEHDLSLYEPLDPSVIEAKAYGNRGIEERGYVPYVCGYQLEKGYRLIKDRVHVCPRCGSSMKDSEGKSPEALGLGCHECGARVKKWKLFYWD